MPELDIVMSRASAALGAALVWWGLCRATHMSAATPLVDKLVLVTFTAAALGYALSPWWYAGETFVEPLLLIGVLGWVGLPWLRAWLDGPTRVAQFVRVNFGRVVGWRAARKAKVDEIEDQL
jgi:hypothetical protein